MYMLKLERYILTLKSQTKKLTKRSLIDKISKRLSELKFKVTQ